MKGPLIPLSLLLALIGNSAQAQLKVRVVSATNPSQGIRSDVFLNHDGTERKLGPTGPDGRATFQGITCQAGMSLRATPLISLAVSGDESDSTPCAGNPVTLKLSPNTGFDSLWAALSAAPSGFGGSRRASYQTALQEADTASGVAFYANEMAYSLEQAGDNAKAAQYRALAISAGNTSLQELGKPSVEDPLVYDPNQRAFVATAETLDALAAFKKEQGLGGRENVWDGRTFERIQALTAAKKGE